MTVQSDHGFVYPTWSFGDRIRKARDIADLNQHDFAAAIGVPDGSLANWETDRSKPRDIVAVAKRVEMLTRIPAAWMLGVDDTNPPPDGGDGGLLLPRMDSNHQPPDFKAAKLCPAYTDRHAA